MAIRNSINNKTSPLTIDPGAASDAWVQFDIAGSNYFRTGVDQTDDAYKLSYGAALGTNDYLTIEATGERRLPYQPLFLAYLGSDDNNVTGGGNIYTLGTNVALTEIFDIGSNFTTAGIFTAPVTGRYLLHGNLKFKELAVGMDNGRMRISTSNRIYFSASANSGAVRDSSDIASFIVECIADLDVGDTARLQAEINNGPTATDLVGRATDPYTWFGGFLLA